MQIYIPKILFKNLILHSKIGAWHKWMVQGEKKIVWETENQANYKVGLIGPAFMGHEVNDWTNLSWLRCAFLWKLLFRHSFSLFVPNLPHFKHTPPLFLSYNHVPEKRKKITTGLLRSHVRYYNNHKYKENQKIISMEPYTVIIMSYDVSVWGVVIFF